MGGEKGFLLSGQQSEVSAAESRGLSDGKGPRAKAMLFSFDPVPGRGEVTQQTKPVAQRFGIKAGATAAFDMFLFSPTVADMAFRTAFFAALCVAQAFAYIPAPAHFARDVVCKNPAVEIAHTFDEAVSGLDEVRETVSMTALDAYSRGGSNLEVIIACFRAQKDSFVKLRQNYVEMMRAASKELAGDLREKAEKYAKLIEEPMMTIYVTMKELPVKVYNHLMAGEYLKAAVAIEDAKKTVQEKGNMIAELWQKMVDEVPPMADKVEKMAKEIRDETKKGCDAIREAFGKCVAEGGPGKFVSDE